MKIELISFAACPYVQRAVIALRAKNVPFDVRYIDLSAKPDWFLAISPRGKVPVLLVDGTPVFESQAIVELLEEAFPVPPLHPSDLVGRARDRAWFAVASEDLFVPMYRAMIARDAEPFLAATGAIETTLRRMEPELAGRDWLSGDGTRFGIADVAMAPFLFRLPALARKWVVPVELTAVRSWTNRVLTHPAVVGSVPDTYQLITDRMTAGSYAQA